MHLLKIIHGYPPLYNAGSEVYSQSVCNELTRRGHRVSVFTRGEDPYAPDHAIRRERRGGVDLYITNKAREKDGYAHPDLDAAFGRLLDELRPDAAHIGHLNHLSTGLPGELAKRGIPVLFTLHDFWLLCPRGQFLQINFAQSEFHCLCPGQQNERCARQCYNRFFGQGDAESDLTYWTNWIGRRMEAVRRAAEQVHLFIAPSRYLMGRFVEEWGLEPERQIRYLDYGFPLHYLQPVQPKTKGPFTFGYIGTHIPAKGINLLLQAFARAAIPQARLLIWGRHAGQSTLRLQNMAEELCPPGSVEFRGEYVNSNLATEVFARVDGIVVPSIWGENSPLVIHEAQACRLPVITADYGGMAEYVRHLENGLLFRHRDPDALCEQLRFAAQNPDLMRRLGQRGYLYHPQGEVPDIESHCDTLEGWYQEAMRQR